MALNPSKSVVIVFGTWQRLQSLYNHKSVNVAGTVIPLSDKVEILSATLDSNLTMEHHTEALSNSCFYHILSFKYIRSSLDDSMADSVASALVTSSLNYVNFILYGTSLKNIASVQNALAGVVAYQHTDVSPSSTPLALLKQLHWLLIEWHIQFMLVILTFKTLHTNRPPYLLTSLSIISLQDVCAHPVLISQ